MGIRADMSSTASTIFSEDILKIEIYGPREDYLTVIDVPGIFRNQTEGITTKEDMIIVHNLVREYIKDKRTIILAVLPSNVDINTQEIIDLAKEYDKLGERTLGVLTKPDLVTEYNTKLSVSIWCLGNGSLCHLATTSCEIVEPTIKTLSNMTLLRRSSNRSHGVACLPIE